VIDDPDLPRTNRDQSCAFCGDRSRFVHRLDRQHIGFRVHDKGWTLPTFWTACDACERLTERGADDELLDRMRAANHDEDAAVQRAALTAFRAADLGSSPLVDAPADDRDLFT
jgi:hypothetical protein